MKPEELRIGNIVLYDHIVIPPNFITANPVILTIDAFDKSNFDPFCKFAPIPLTPEWLDKFGFEKHPYKKNGGQECVIWKKGIDQQNKNHPNEYFIIENVSSEEPPLWCIELQGPSGFVIITIQIQYVHQLQNLYYALTGKELG
jgi:hypothetical protein